MNKINNETFFEKPTNCKELVELCVVVCLGKLKNQDNGCYNVCFYNYADTTF